MFEYALADPPELRRLGDSALVSAISDSARVAAAAEARCNAAIDELVRRRVIDEHPDWACDDWDACAAEVACALTVSQSRASGKMTDAVAQRDMPLVAAAHLDGHLSARTVETMCDRTSLVTDPAARAAIDADLAEAAARFGPLSKYKLEKVIDAIVERRDPGGVKRARDTMQGRDFTIGDANDRSGTATVWGRLSATDAALLQAAVDSLVASVCPKDPRTRAQRRADAVGALAVRATRLPCRCARPDCPAGTGPDEVAARFVIHVLADASTLTATADPAMHGDGDTDEDGPGAGAGPGPDPDDPNPGPDDPDGPDPDCAPPGPTPPVRPAAALLAEMPRGAVLPAALVADLITRGARVRSLTAGESTPDSGYRPSAAHARFVRTRDLTCRFPGCDKPAVNTDIDHTVPWPAGPTHPSNNNCRCRSHHLLKTFWPGWTESQEPDGTLNITTPSGCTYVTKPFAALLFPGFNTTTAVLPPASAPAPSPARGLKMPKRKQPRAKERAARIQAERALNIEPPF